jgi:hypothetical protein
MKMDGSYEMITEFNLSDYAKSKLQITTNELLEEREAVADLLKM